MVLKDGEVYISIVTRASKEIILDYLQFGAKIIEEGKSRDLNAFVATCPEEHAHYNVGRLGSGLHGARAHKTSDELDEWKNDFAYEKEE